MKPGDEVAVEASRARDNSAHANAQSVLLTRTNQKLFSGSAPGQQ